MCNINFAAGKVNKTSIYNREMLKTLLSNTKEGY